MTTETTPTENTMDPSTGTQEHIDWEKRYKDLQSYHDKSKQSMVSQEEFQAIQGELKSLQGHSHITTQKEILGSLHPDFGSVVQSDQFGEWIQSQPTAMQEAIYNEDKLDGSLAGSALTLFKTQMGAPAVPDTTNAAAMAVSGGHRETPEVSPKPTYTYAQIDAMSPDEYKTNRDAIQEAHREGRIR